MSEEGIIEYQEKLEKDLGKFNNAVTIANSMTFAFDVIVDIYALTGNQGQLVTPEAVISCSGNIGELSLFAALASLTLTCEKIRMEGDQEKMLDTSQLVGLLSSLIYSTT